MELSRDMAKVGNAQKMLEASNIPAWLNDLWTCAADNNTGFPIPCHITKTNVMSREFPSAPAPLDAPLQFPPLQMFKTLHLMFLTNTAWEPQTPLLELLLQFQIPPPLLLLQLLLMCRPLTCS